MFEILNVKLERETLKNLNQIIRRKGTKDGWMYWEDVKVMNDFLEFSSGAWNF